jgi:hypothetical protein
MEGYDPSFDDDGGSVESISSYNSCSTLSEELLEEAEEQAQLESLSHATDFMNFSFKNLEQLVWGPRSCRPLQDCSLDGVTVRMPLLATAPPSHRHARLMPLCVWCCRHTTTWSAWMC